MVSLFTSMLSPQLKEKLGIRPRTNNEIKPLSPHNKSLNSSNIPRLPTELTTEVRNFE